MQLILLGTGVALVVLGIFAAALVAGYRRRRTERAEQLVAQRVDAEFRRVFGDTLPTVDPYTRNQPGADDRPAKRSNWNAGKVRPQG